MLVLVDASTLLDTIISETPTVPPVNMSNITSKSSPTNPASVADAAGNNVT